MLELPRSCTPGAAEETPQGRFLRFYREHAGGLYAYLRSQCDSPEEADDALQEAFFRLWQHGAEAGENVWNAGYLFRGARNFVIDRRRARAGERKSLQARAGCLRFDHAGNSEIRDWADAVTQALASLDAETRGILVMHVYQELPLRDIAGILDMPYDSVTYRWQRGIAALQTLLGNIS